MATEPTEPTTPRGRYRNHQPTAITLVFGDAKPANRLRMPLARIDATEEPTMSEPLELDADLAPVIAALQVPRADEAAIAEAAGDDMRVVHAMRLLSGAKPEVIARVLDAACIARPAPAEPPPAPDPLTPEARALVEQANARSAAAEAAVAKLNAERKREAVVAMCRADFAHLPGIDAADSPAKLVDLLCRCEAKLDPADYAALTLRLKNASAAVAGSRVFAVAGADGEGETDNAAKLEQLVAERMKTAGESRARAMRAVQATPDGVRLALVPKGARS